MDAVIRPAPQLSLRAHPWRSEGWKREEENVGSLAVKGACVWEWCGGGWRCGVVW